MTVIKAPEVSLSIYGGVFDTDGSGQFPGLELMNFVLVSTGELLQSEGKVELERVAHDFTRRLMCDDSLEDEVKREYLYDNHSESAIVKLLKSLEIVNPNTNTTASKKKWERTHLFPYTRSLVHWDARIRYDRVLIERRYFRGAGAYAYSILRKDADENRLGRIRKKLAELYSKDDVSPLEMLARTLKAAGEKDDAPNEDIIENKSELKNDQWEELYREGVDNILSHSSASSVEKIRSLVNWTGLWSVIMISGRTADFLGIQKNGFILDCAEKHPQLRREAQRSYKNQLSNIERSVIEKASALNGELSVAQINKIKGYFGKTVVSSGIGNAWKGRRHFKLRLEAIDTLVMAGIKEGEEMEFDNFLFDWLFERCGLVIGRKAAEQMSLLSNLDATIFEENEQAVIRQMHSAGLLKMYSDATRMVSYGASS
jgi:hypothetical protein